MVIEDQSECSPKAGFDIRTGSKGMYNLIRWLLQKAGMLAVTAVERQFKPSRRRRFKATSVSPARQRLAVQVLIKNAVCTTIHLRCVAQSLIKSIFRKKSKTSSRTKALALTD